MISPPECALHLHWFCWWEFCYSCRIAQGYLPPHNGNGNSSLWARPFPLHLLCHAASLIFNFFFFKWLSMHFWVLIFRRTLGSPSSPRLLQDQLYINIFSYSYSEQQRPIQLSFFFPFFFFERGQTLLYWQPSASLSFRPSNSSIHYGEPSSPPLHDSAIKMTY